jgi:hypothetical protein
MVLSIRVFPQLVVTALPTEPSFMKMKDVSWSVTSLETRIIAAYHSDADVMGVYCLCGLYAVRRDGKIECENRSCAFSLPDKDFDSIKFYVKKVFAKLLGLDERACQQILTRGRVLWLVPHCLCGAAMKIQVLQSFHPEWNQGAPYYWKGMCPAVSGCDVDKVSSAEMTRKIREFFVKNPEMKDVVIKQALSIM